MPVCNIPHVGLVVDTSRECFPKSGAVERANKSYQSLVTDNVVVVDVTSTAMEVAVTATVAGAYFFLHSLNIVS